MRGNQQVYFFLPQVASTDHLGDVQQAERRIGRNARVRFGRGGMDDLDGVELSHQDALVTLAWDRLIAEGPIRGVVEIDGREYKIAARKTPRRSAGLRRLQIVAEAIQ